MNQVYQIGAEFPIFPSEQPNQVAQIAIETAWSNDQFYHVTGSIGNNRIDGHVISYRRYASLCNPGQRISLNLDTSYPNDVVPGMLVVIYEKGVKVLTGYVIKSMKTRPSYEWLIDIEDTYTRVANYFISEELDFESPQQSYELIRQILEPTEIAYRIVGENVIIPSGTVLGLRSAHDALNDVMTYGSWYAWVDPEGVLQIKKHARKTPIVIRDPISVEHRISTEQTRNVVKIYGQARTPDSSVNISLSADVEGLITDLTTVVANPLISNYDDAERIGNYLLQELGKRTDILTFTVEGDPTIRIGTSGSLYYSDPSGLITSGSGAITSVETRIDQSGYITVGTIGERCPRISGWSVDPRELRAIWIAACSRGTSDPRPEKLVWSADYGAGGQPTYHIVKDIPSGQIAGMHVLRNGRRVYLIMTEGTICSLYACDNPYDRTPEWSRLYTTNDALPGVVGEGIDAVYFNTGAFGSAQVVNDTLYFSVRTQGAGGSRSHYYAEIKGQSMSVTRFITAYTENIISNTTTKNLTFIASNPSVPITLIYATDPFQVEDGYHGLEGATYFKIPNQFTFDHDLINGVSRNVASRNTGNIWVNDIDDPRTGTVLFADATGNRINNRATPIFTATNKLLNNQVRVRGDYWGSQYQFVDGDGNIYVGNGGLLAKKFTWKTSVASYGIVNCMDKTRPAKMSWFPQDQAIFNEISRYSIDGGETWENMTGNWWGSNSEVLNGSKMQSQGNFALIDCHPTFWSSEIDEE